MDGPELGLTVQASSVGEEARFRMGTRARGLVHSVFAEALNFVFPKGVVSVVLSSRGRGPINVVLAANRPASFAFGPMDRGSEVSFEGGLLTIGDKLHVLLEGAKLYRSPVKFRSRVPSFDHIRMNVANAQEQILESGRLDGLGHLLRISNVGTLPKEATPPFLAATLPSVISLTKELSRGSVTGSVAAARGLLGLGVGLTPSGDDLLSGVLLTMILGSKNGIRGPPRTREVAARVALEAAKRTTLLSQNYIELASRGEGNEVVIRFVEELFTGSNDALSQSLAELLDFGATSGTDIATGVIIGARIALGDKVGAT